MSAPAPKVDFETCKKGSFWSTEIKSGKVKSKPACCSLFKNDPSELPFFCPPTPSWCKYEQEGGKWSSFTKGKCCKFFGSELSSCEKTTKLASGGSAGPKTSSNEKPDMVIAQALGLDIKNFNFVEEGNVYDGDHVETDTNANAKDLHILVAGNTYKGNSSSAFLLII